MKYRLLRWLASLALLLSGAGLAFAQGTAFIYQGRLNDNGSPAHGNYDLTFSVFDADNGNNQISGTLTNAPVGVSNGLFAVVLNFGAGIFTGPERWLEIGVRTNGAGDFTPLSPRQLLAPTPYAIMANAASNLLGLLPTSQLSGTLPSSLLEGTFTGALIFNNPANSFTGSGTGLTALNASNLASGTVADARLSSNVARLSGNQTFSGSNRFSGVVELTHIENTFVGSFSGDGAALTNLSVQAANVLGTLADGQLSANIARLDGDATFTGALIFNNPANNFAGSGIGLTALNASNLASGTMADARLSSNVARLSGNQTFSGSNFFSGVGVLTNMGSRFAGSFSGDGSGLTNLSASELSGNLRPPASVTPVLGMIWIQPGTFFMGSPTNDPDSFENERPQTVVTLTRGFWMGNHEVTQDEYLAVVGSNPSFFTGDLNRPVEQVSWSDATNYCGLLTQAQRTAGRIPSHWVYRLPTEAEWEYACRAGPRTTRFGYGDDLSGSALINYGWFSDNSGNTTHPVEQKLANPWGLMDMHGNVYEWCQDTEGTYPGGSVTDPQGPGSGSNRVIRSGCWCYIASYCRSAQRSSENPATALSVIGFRVVLAPN